MDDGIFGSPKFCAQCLLGGIERLWPKDVGPKLEEEGVSIRFLIAQLSVSPDNVLSIEPIIVNKNFTMGSDLFPERSWRLDLK